MGFKTVVIKGLGKIKFPASMTDDAIEKSIKNLDMSEAARMARAKEQGFKLETYRGLQQPYDENVKTRIIWSTPSVDYANIYAEQARGQPGGTMMPLNVKSVNPFDFGYRTASTQVKKADMLDRIKDRVLTDFDDGKIDEKTAKEIFKKIRDKQKIAPNDYKAVWQHWQDDEDIVDLLKGAGYDGIMSREGADNVEAIGVFSPSQVRGKYAAFNPDAKDSPSLLASAAGATLGLGALAQSDDSEAAGLKGFTRIFSGTRGEPIKSVSEIVPLGKYRKGHPNNYFGGVFGSIDRDVAEGHGEKIQEFLIPDEKLASHDDIVNSLLYEDDGLETLRNAVKDTMRENLTDDELDELSEFVAERMSPFDDVPEMGEERLFEILGVSDAGEASWKLQGLKGEFARRKGFEAVGMPDEHGESVLVLGGPGTSIANMAAPFAAGAGLAALSQSNVSEAAQDPRTASVSGTIQGPAQNREGIAKLSEFIDKHDDIVFDDLLGGITAWLDKVAYDDKRTFKDRLMAALDLI